MCGSHASHKTSTRVCGSHVSHKTSTRLHVYHMTIARHPLECVGHILIIVIERDSTVLTSVLHLLHALCTISTYVFYVHPFLMNGYAIYDMMLCSDTYVHT